MLSEASYPSVMMTPSRAAAWRIGAIIVLLFGFAVRAAIPLGYMPAVVDGHPEIITCDGHMHGPGMAGMHGRAGAPRGVHSKSGHMTPCPFGAPAIDAPFAGIAAPAPQAILRETINPIDPAAPKLSFIRDLRQRGPPSAF